MEIDWGQLNKNDDAPKKLHQKCGVLAEQGRSEYRNADPAPYTRSPPHAAIPCVDPNKKLYCGLR